MHRFQVLAHQLLIVTVQLSHPMRWDKGTIIVYQPKTTIPKTTHLPAPRPPHRLSSIRRSFPGQILFSIKKDLLLFFTNLSFLLNWLIFVCFFFKMSIKTEDSHFIGLCPYRPNIIELFVMFMFCFVFYAVQTSIDFHFQFNHCFTWFDFQYQPLSPTVLFRFIWYCPELVMQSIKPQKNKKTKTLSLLISHV